MISINVSLPFRDFDSYILLWYVLIIPRYISRVVAVMYLRFDLNFAFGFSFAVSFEFGALVLLLRPLTREVPEVLHRA